jgi:hypothetical protein
VVEDFPLLAHPATSTRPSAAMRTARRRIGQE